MSLAHDREEKRELSPSAPVAVILAHPKAIYGTVGRNTYNFSSASSRAIGTASASPEARTRAAVRFACRSAATNGRPPSGPSDACQMLIFCWGPLSALDCLPRLRCSKGAAVILHATGVLVIGKPPEFLEKGRII